MILLIFFGFIALMFFLAERFGKVELYKCSGVIPGENRRVVFYESEDYDNAMVIATFGWKARGLEDIVVEWGESELPIDEHGNRSVKDPYWAKEQ